MGFLLWPAHLKQYRKIGWFLAKYGRSDAVKLARKKKPFAELENHGTPAEARELTDDLQKLGPTFIKFGQLLSTQPDLLPPAYVEALSKLQDDIDPFPYDQAKEVIEEELGIRLSKAFDSFESEPLAAASLGQVHRAILRDGRLVAIKVQRPGIRDQIVEDLEVLSHLAVFADRHTKYGRRHRFVPMLEEFRKSLLLELDYSEEAANLRFLRHNLREFDRIVVPAPIEDFTTSRVLTMEYLRGRKITDLGPLLKIELDGEQLAHQLFHAYLKQILDDGFFHADPHPGNVLLTEDRRIALIDLGMVARVTPGLRDRLLQLLQAVSEGQAEDVADILTRIGRPLEAFDAAEFGRQVADIVMRQRDQTVQQLDVGSTVLAVMRASDDTGIVMPQELTMIGKALLNLNHIGRAVYPEFDPNAAVRKYTVGIFRDRLLESIVPGNIFRELIDVKSTLSQLPRHLNRILERVANNDIEVTVDAIDEPKLLEGIQKVANRITVGLVLAALIIGAALLMDVPTGFTIFGYPGLAMAFFLAASLGGLALVINIILTDVTASRRG